MNKVATTLFIPDTSGGSEFLLLPETQKRYPRLLASALARPLKSRPDWEVLARSLITFCQYAHNAREIGVLREVSEFLVSLPLPERLRPIGRYYQAKVLLHTAEFDAARAIFEELATHPQFLWKAKALASAGTCHWYKGNFEDATELCLEAQRAAIKGNVGLGTSLKLEWLVAVIRSAQGDHHNALKLLENFHPLVLYLARSQPVTYYDYVNSVAVEQMAIGRFNEAERLCQIALSSPFAPNFPNWNETREELRAAREEVAATVFVNIAFDESLAPAVQDQKNCEHSIHLEPERRRITLSLIARRSAGAEAIAARLIRAKAAVAASRDRVSKPFFTSIKPRAPPACITNREDWKSSDQDALCG